MTEPDLYDRPEFTGPAPVIDLDRPVALSVNSLVHFIPGQDAYDLVTALMARLAPGSLLILSSITRDFAPKMMDEVAASYSSSVVPLELRTKAQIERFFDGLDMVDPGVVPYPMWRPASDDVIPPLDHVNGFCGVAIKHG